MMREGTGSSCLVDYINSNLKDKTVGNLGKVFNRPWGPGTFKIGNLSLIHFISFEDVLVELMPPGLVLDLQHLWLLVKCLCLILKALLVFMHMNCFTILELDILKKDLVRKSNN